MPEWTCPSCDGGFPKPVLKSTTYRCPWCAEPIAKWAGDLREHIVEETFED